MLALKWVTKLRIKKIRMNNHKIITNILLQKLKKNTRNKLMI